MAKCSIALTRIRKEFPEVTTIADARKPVRLTVTKADQDKAKRLDASMCALAMACGRELKMDGAVIGMTTCVLIKGSHATRYSTPESVKRELISFDRHGDFDSGQYHLAKMGSNNKLGRSGREAQKDPRKRHISKNAALPRVSMHYTLRVRRIAHPKPS